MKRRRKAKRKVVLSVTCRLPSEALPPLPPLPLSPLRSLYSSLNSLLFSFFLSLFFFFFFSSGLFDKLPVLMPSVQCPLSTPINSYIYQSFLLTKKEASIIKVIKNDL